MKNLYAVTAMLSALLFLSSASLSAKVTPIERNQCRKESQLQYKKDVQVCRTTFRAENKDKEKRKSAKKNYQGCIKTAQKSRATAFNACVEKFEKKTEAKSEESKAETK